MFHPVPTNVSFPELETEILRFWKDRRIYEKSLQERAGGEKFVFYEGPPTVNGLPHPGHCLTRIMKDLFPRYRTMRGYYCERKGGWDTHGLPVEVEVCKELGIHSKDEIEAYGIEPFIHKCQESVWRYMRQWERLTERLGFWIHLDEAYVTYHRSYVESVWWSLAHLFNRGLLYQGHKIVWWWAQGGTALSAGEVGQGYREVADPSVFVRFPLRDDPDVSLLVWTTTPWTLPNNQFAAVHPELDYSLVVDEEDGKRLILASALVESVVEKVKRPLKVASTCKGSELLGKRYGPPFSYFEAALADKKGRLKSGTYDYLVWRVLAADFVTVDSGTGIVHQAPAFGEVDYDVLLAEQERFVEGQGPELLCSVAADGNFDAQTPDLEGRWVKDADRDIVRDLRSRGLLYHQEQYVHDYPFCWRAEEDPLIQYPRKSWFIRTAQFKDKMLANNRRINWLPEHIGEGRFGNFLDTNVDWALSRERYWGTPLPIWVCDTTGKKEAIATYDELVAKPGVAGTDVWQAAKRANPKLSDHLMVHKPYIDAVTYDSPFAQGGRMKRVTEVIDCWFDAGAMPFAQWGYPHKGREQFESQFPADFISEAIDQTRGWFYSQLAISTMLFTDEESTDPDAPTHPLPHPYRNCVVLGLMMGEDGRKMSKSRRNYREPDEIFDRYGADALRWYFLAGQPPWTTIRYSEQAIKESIPTFLLRLWNVYSFFVIYANIDGFDPAALLKGGVGQLTSGQLAAGTGYRPIPQRDELDRWVLSELSRTAAAVTQRMDAYDNYVAGNRLDEFVDALSNWYVRRSRDRFWSGDKQSTEKRDAYWTLYECLLTTAKLIAPFVPFLAETLWQNLAGVFAGRAAESVHLCDYPTDDPIAVDDRLSNRMELVREIVSLGRGARMDAKLKVRQPLAKVEVILANATHLDWLQSHVALIGQELNVKQVEFTEEAERYITYELQPNFKSLGPRLGRLMPAVKKALLEAEGGPLLAQLKAEGKITLDVAGERIELDERDVEIRLQAKPGWAAAQGASCVVVLSAELTEPLILEGLARDVIRLVQQQRKELDCQYTDRIEVTLSTDAQQLKTAVSENTDYMKKETLAVGFEVKPLDNGQVADLRVGEHELTLDVRVV